MGPLSGAQPSPNNAFAAVDSTLWAISCPPLVASIHGIGCIGGELILREREPMGNSLLTFRTRQSLSNLVASPKFSSNELTVMPMDESGNTVCHHKMPPPIGYQLATAPTRLGLWWFKMGWQTQFRGTIHTLLPRPNILSFERCQGLEANLHITCLGEVAKFS